MQHETRGFCMKGSMVGIAMLHASVATFVQHLQRLLLNIVFFQPAPQGGSVYPKVNSYLGFFPPKAF